MKYRQQLKIQKRGSIKAMADYPAATVPGFAFVEMRVGKIT
jgi:hypothetical protein